MANKKVFTDESLATFVDEVKSYTDSAVSTKANSSHNHAASNITSGTLSSDRLPTVPIAKGGTGATTAAAALTNLGITATASELNKLDGVTATTAELNYVDGVTSNIQTQLNGKLSTSGTAAKATADASGNTITSTYETKSDASAKLDEAKEYTDTVASGKANSSHTHTITDVTDLQTTLDGKVPTSRTINGKVLSSNITLSASDVGAAASSHSHSSYVNQNAFSNVVVGSTTIAADTTTDSLTIAAGTGISVSGDATNDKVTITNSGVRSISTGSSNGTISVNTNGSSANVAVKGLGSAAYTASTAYDAAGTAQTKADSALASAKSYTDDKIALLMNNSSEAVDSIMELATAMEENADVVAALNDAIGTKVDKVSGKGLSTNDYTTTEKNKLSGIASGAQVNQNAFSNVKVGDTTIAADTTTDTLTLVAGSNITLTPDATGDSVTITAKDTTYTLGSFGITATASELNKLDGVTATATELNYVDGVTSNIQTQLDGKASSSHTHNYAGSSSAGGAATSANKVNNSLTVKLNSGTTEGTNMFTFNGSGAKSVNITPSSIGAAASSHTHDDRYYTESEIDTKLSGKANSSHGNHVPATQTASNKIFLRNDNTWATVTPANIGAATSGHTHTASLATDTGTSAITLAHGGKYKLTAGGSSVIFTMPTDNNTVYTHPSSHPASMITGLATVATSGSYNDLSNKPTIPTVPSSLKNPNSLGIKVNSETSSFVTYDGSAAKTLTIAPSSTNGAFTISDGTTIKTIQLAGKFTDTTYSLGSFGITATAAELNYCDGVTSNIQTQLNGKLGTSGGNISGHIYLTGSQASSSTGNTSQLVFGTSSNNHVVLSSNDNTLVINPTTTTTTNQIVLYLDKQSQFPSGITSAGTINGKTLQENGTALSSKYAAKSHTHSEYASSSHTHTASEVGAVATSLVDSSGTFNDTTKNNIPTKGAVASYAVSNFASKTNLSALDTRVTALENSSGGSSSGGGLTEGGSLNSATIGDFYCRYINDSTSTSSYVTTADLIECVTAYNNGELGGSGGGYTEGDDVSFHNLGVSGSAYFSGGVNVGSGNFYIAGTHIDEYIADAVACLMEGTLITMADGSKKPIEEVEEGELLKSIDLETGEETTAVCLGNRVGDVKEYYYCLMFDNGMRAKTNWTHDIYNATKGTWTNTDQELELDDEIVIEDGSKTKFIGRLEAIGTPNGRKVRFYDIISSNNCYYADGVLFSHTPTKQSGWVNKHSEDAPTELTNLITSYKNETHRETDLMQKDEYVNQYLDTMHSMLQKESKLRELKDNLSRTDYVTLKLSEGVEITDAMQEVIDSRKEWRKLYNEYEVELSDIYKKANDLKVKYSDMGEDVLLSMMELRKKFFDESCKKGNENLERFKEFYRTSEKYEVNY